MDGRERLAFLPLQDERALPAAQAVPEDVRFTTFHLVTTTGAGLHGGAAVVETLAAVDRTARIGRVLRRQPLRKVVDAFYAFLARSKGFWGRFVRDAPGPVRWP